MSQKVFDLKNFFFYNYRDSNPYIKFWSQLLEMQTSFGCNLIYCVACCTFTRLGRILKWKELLKYKFMPPWCFLNDNHLLKVVGNAIAIHNSLALAFTHIHIHCKLIVCLSSCIWSQHPRVFNGWN